MTSKNVNEGPATTPDPTGGNKENEKPSNNRGNSNARNKHHQEGNGRFLSALTQTYEYKGENEEVGVILTLPDERFKFRAPFSSFQKKLKHYALQNYSFPKDIMLIVEKLEDPDATIKKDEPAELSSQDAQSDSKKWRWHKDLERHIKQVSDLDDNKASLYGLIWGQCTNALQEVIKTDEDYVSYAADFDCVWLLKNARKFQPASMREEISIITSSKH